MFCASFRSTELFVSGVITTSIKFNSTNWTVIDLESLANYVVAYAVTISTPIVLDNIVISKNFIEFYVHFYEY